MSKRYPKAYREAHPEYFVRIDPPAAKPDPKGKRWTDGMFSMEVRRWGVYPRSGKKRWTTVCVETGKPDTRRQLVRPSFVQAERSLEAYAKRLGLIEVKE